MHTQEVKLSDERKKRGDNLCIAALLLRTHKSSII